MTNNIVCFLLFSLPVAAVLQLPVVVVRAVHMRGHRGFLLEVPSHAGMFSPRAANPT